LTGAIQNQFLAGCSETSQFATDTMNSYAKLHGPSGKAGQIVAELERRLFMGHYNFGDTLSINLLANEFGSSRQPISAALNHLRSVGYVRIVPQVGCEIVSLTASEIDDFFYTLSKIEGAMAGFAAARNEGAEAEVLTSIANDVNDIPFESATSREDLSIGVDAYHEQIRSMARSPSLKDRVHNLWRLSIFYLWQGAQNLEKKDVDAANRERRAIAKAIANGDVEGAESLMEKHVRGKPRRVRIV
jgi:DNA-binding GntR family transcriptional regulator